MSASSLKLVARPQPLTLGLLRLADSAPVIVAKELDFFADEGLEVRLSVEPSWANIADKLSYGQLDGGILLPPMALAMSLGLRGPAVPIVIPLALSLNGNTVTLANGCDLKAKPRLAVVHAFSTHHLLLRYWLAADGIDPGCDVTLDVIPPARIVEALRAGRIAGFCAGPPWGEIAVRAGLARTAAHSYEIWNNHPDKVFAVRRSFAEERPVVLAQLLRALIRAARFCDEPENRPGLARMIAGPRYLDLDPDAVLASLAPVKFFANAATFPWLSHARWYQRQMARWGFVAAGSDISGIYRPDLYRAAAADIGVAVPRQDTKTEGGHAEPWILPGSPSDIPMGPDRFCDGATFDPNQEFSPCPIESTGASS